MPTDDTDDHEESLSPEARERLEAGLADARAGRYRTVDVAMFDDTDPAAVPPGHYVAIHRTRGALAHDPDPRVVMDRVRAMSDVDESDVILDVSDTDPAAVAERKLRRIADHLTYCPHPKLGSLGDAEYCYRCGSIRRWGERHWTSPNLIDAIRAAKGAPSQFATEMRDHFQHNIDAAIAEHHAAGRPVYVERDGAWGWLYPDGSFRAAKEQKP